MGRRRLRRGRVQTPLPLFPAAPFRLLLKFEPSPVGGYGGLLVRAAQHHDAMEVLHAPTGADELRREPVEQREIGRRFIPRTEVGGRACERFAKMMHPDAIHEDASRQWVVRRSNGLCQIKPATAMTAQKVTNSFNANLVP